MRQITPTMLADCLVKRGYNRELSATYIANTYLMGHTNENWHKDTFKDINACMKELKDEVQP